MSRIEQPAGRSEPIYQPVDPSVWSQPATLAAGLGLALAVGLTIWFNRDLRLSLAVGGLLYFAVLHGVSAFRVFFLSRNRYTGVINTSLLIVGLGLGTGQAMIVGLAANLVVGLGLLLGRSLAPQGRVQIVGHLRRTAWASAATTVALLPIAPTLDAMHVSLRTTMLLDTRQLVSFGLASVSYFLLMAAADALWTTLIGRNFLTVWQRNWKTLLGVSGLPLLFLPLVVLPYFAWPHLRWLIFLAYLGATALLYQIEQAQLRHAQRLNELQVLNAIGQGLTARLDLNDLLETIHREIGKLLDTSGFYLALYDEAAGTIQFPIIFRSGQRLRPSSRPLSGGMTEWVIQNRRRLILNRRVYQRSRAMGITPFGREPHSFLAVPIIFGQTVLGVMALQNYDAFYRYTRQDAQLLETIAAQTGIALHNARLYDMSQRQSRELAALNQVSALLGKATQLDETLNSICEVALGVAGSHKIAIFLVNEDGRSLRMAGQAGFSKMFQVQSGAISITTSDRAESFRTGEPLSTADVEADDRFKDALEDLRREGVRAVLEVPLRIGERVMGTVAAYYAQPRTFDAGEFALMGTLGPQIAVVVENVRLFDQMRARSREMQALYEASTAINATLSLRNVLQAVAISMISALEIESCTAFLTREDGLTLRSELRLIAAEKRIAEEQIEIVELARDAMSILNDAVRLQIPYPLQRNHEGLGAGDARLLAYCKVQSALLLPLIYHEKLVGLIVVGDRQIGRSFDVDEMRMASALANQAAIAVQNARLFEQTDVALGRRLNELAALETLAQRMTRRLDLADVISQVVEAAAAATDADFVEVALLDEKHNMFNVMARQSGNLSTTGDQWPATEGITGRALRLGQAVRVDDVGKDRDYVLLRPETRSELAVPIILDRRRLGVLNLESRHTVGFTDDHVRFVGNLAEYAAIAIENARLFESTRRRAEEFTALRAIAVELLSSSDLNHVLRVVAREALNRTGAANVHIYLYDPEHEKLTFGASLWASGEIDREFATPRPDGLTMTAARSGERVVVRNPDTHPLTASMGRQAGWDSQLVSVPLKWSERVVGVFNVAFDVQHHIDDDLLHFFDLMAAQAAVAIATAQLYESERQQRRIAEILLGVSSAITSSLELGPIIVVLSRHLLDVSGCHVIRIHEWDREHDRLRTLSRYARAIWPDGAGRAFTLDEYQAAARVLQTGKPETFFQRMADPDPDQLTWMRDRGFAGQVMLPLRSGPDIVGMVEIVSAAERLVHDKSALRRAMKVIKQAAEWFTVPLTTLSRREVFDLGERLLDAVGGEGCAFWLWDQEADEVSLAAEISNLVWNPGEGPVTPLEPAMTMHEVVKRGISRVVHPSDPQLGEKEQYFFSQWNAQTLVVQPLSDKGQIIGLIELFDVRERRTPSEDDLGLWRAVSDQATVALSNARLVAETRAARDRLQSILDSIYDGILMFDVDGNLMMANPRVEYLLNVRIGDYIGKHLSAILREVRHIEGVRELAAVREIRKLRKQAQDNPFVITRREYVLPHPTPRAIEEVSLAVVGIGGRVLGRLFILRDMTQVYEIERYRSMLSDMIVHDLRSPLGGIISGLHVALDELASPQAPDAGLLNITLGVALSSAQTLLTLVETILDISKLESGELPLTLEPLNLGQIARQTVRLFEHMAAEAHIDLRLSIPRGLPDILADEEKVRRIFTNLIDNALRYTPAGGQVRIIIRDEPAAQTVTVTDTGSGISEGDRERIFGRFVQLDSSPPRRGAKGSGLGLTFCLLAVEAHGGRIWVGEGKEHGAAFHFTLPRNLSTRAAEEVEPEAVGN